MPIIITNEKVTKHGSSAKNAVRTYVIEARKEIRGNIECNRDGIRTEGGQEMTWDV